MRKNILRFIELIIILCVIVVGVREWDYNGFEGKILPTPTPIYDEQIALIQEYFTNSLNNDELGPRGSMDKTINWLNKKGSLYPPIPRGVVKAHVETYNKIIVTFDNGKNISIYVGPSYSPSGLILK